MRFTATLPAGYKESVQVPLLCLIITSFLWMHHSTSSCQPATNLETRSFNLSAYFQLMRSSITGKFMVVVPTTCSIKLYYLAMS